MRQEYLKCSSSDNSSRSYHLPDNHPYLASDNENRINLTAVNVQENTVFNVRKNIFKNNLIQNTKKYETINRHQRN